MKGVTIDEAAGTATVGAGLTQKETVPALGQRGFVIPTASEGGAASAVGFSAAASALAMLMGPATLVGFDAAANLTEEAKDAHRTSLDPSTIAASFPM